MLVSLAIVVVVTCAAWWKPGVGLALATQGYLIRNAFVFDPGPAVATESADATGGAGDPLGAILPGVVFLIIGIKALDGFWRYRVDVVDILLLALGGVLLLGSLHAPDRGIGAEIALRYFALGISFYFFARLMLAEGSRRAEQNLLAFLTTTWATGLVLGGVALLYWGLAAERLTVGYAHPIPFSLLIGMALLINVYWLIWGSNTIWVTASLYAGLGFLAFVFIASNTRGTAVALAICLLLFATLVIRKQFSFTTIANIAMIVTSVGLIAVALLSWQPEVVDRTQERFSLVTASDKGQSITEREAAYSDALSMFSSHSIWGVGTGGFAAYSGVEPYPHNMVLEIASEQGIVGLTVLALLLGVILIYAAATFTVWRNNLILPLLAALVMFNLVEAQFSFTLWAHKNLFVVLGLFISQLARSKRLLSIPSTHSEVPSGVSQNGERKAAVPLRTSRRKSPTL